MNARAVCEELEANIGDAIGTQYGRGTVLAEVIGIRRRNAAVEILEGRGWEITSMRQVSSDGKRAVWLVRATEDNK